MCIPLTTKAVPTPPGWLTVPAVIGVPSPQSMRAVKSAIVEVGSPSVNEATGPLKSGGAEDRNREDRGFDRC